MNTLKTHSSFANNLDITLKKDIESLTFYHTAVVEKMKEITSPLVEKGLISFGYTKLFPNGDRILLENNTDWLYKFFDCQLYKDSSDQKKVIELIKQAPEDTIYASLWPHIPSTLTQNILFNHQKVWNGVSLFKKDSTSVEIYHFGADRNNEKKPDFYLNNFDFLKRFISYFLLSSTDILNKATHHALKGQFLPFSLSNASHPSTTTNQMNYSLSLTKREKECLSLLSKGKRAKEIAYNLGISVRTVECYVLTLKRKFRAHTLAELLFLASLF